MAVYCMAVCKNRAGMLIARHARSVPTKAECKKYATFCYESGMNLAWSVVLCVIMAWILLLNQPILIPYHRLHTLLTRCYGSAIGYT